MTLTEIQYGATVALTLAALIGVGWAFLHFYVNRDHDDRRRRGG